MDNLDMKLLLLRALRDSETPMDLFRAVEDLPGLKVEATDTSVTFGECSPLTLTPVEDLWVSKDHPGLTYPQILTWIESERSARDPYEE